MCDGEMQEVHRGLQGRRNERERDGRIKASEVAARDRGVDADA